MPGEPAQPAVSEVTAVLAALDRGEEAAVERLLPLVYDQLRSLARARMAHESPGQTLQPTALVHEAYMRLVGNTGAHFKSRAHFFGAAAEAMRRILIERARQRKRLRHGGGRRRQALETDLEPAAADADTIDLEHLDQAMSRLANLDHRLRDVVMFRFYAGLSVDETAEVMNVSPRTVKRDWEFARTWLHREMSAAPDAPGGDGSEDARGS
ncbi:MAG: ECF-type sigma factor [Phycisphaerales bacterium]